MKRKPRNKGPYNNQHTFWGYLLVILLIVGVAVWNYEYLVIETNDDVPEILSSLADIAPLGQAWRSNTYRIGLFESPATIQFARSVKSDYLGVLKNWRDFLHSSGLSVTTFRDTALLNDFHMVILAETICLSSEDTQNIKNYLIRGGSVFMIGAVGSRDEHGRWSDAHLFGDVVGMRFAGNANWAPPSPVTITLKGNLPVSPVWTPRSHITLQSYNPVLTGRLVEKRATIAATVPYIDQSLDEPPVAMPVLCYGQYLNGRFAWSGFSPETTSTATRNTSREATRELFGNLMEWLLGAPKIRTQVWPNEMFTAVSMIVDLSGSGAKLGWQQLLNSRLMQYPVTLVFPWDELDEYEDQLKNLGKEVQVAVSIDPRYLNVNRANPDRMNLLKLRRKLQQLSLKENFGLLVHDLPPHDFAREAITSGFHYILSQPTGDIEDYPEILMAYRHNGWFQHPHTISLAPYRTVWNENVLQSRTVIQLFSPETNFADIPGFIQWLETHKESLWITSVNDMVEWRKIRNAIAMDRQFLSGGRIRVRFTNGSYNDLNYFTFSVMFPDRAGFIDIWPKAVAMPLPETLGTKDSQTWSFSIEYIPPGRTFEYVLTPLRSQQSNKSEISPKDRFPYSTNAHE